MTLGAVIITLILVESKVKLSTVLNYRTVERRKQDVVLIVKFWYGNNEQTMIFSSITVHQSRCTIGTRTVCSKQFTTEGFLQVGHYRFF